MKNQGTMKKLSKRGKEAIDWHHKLVNATDYEAKQNVL